MVALLAIPKLTCLHGPTIFVRDDPNLKPVLSSLSLPHSTNEEHGGYMTRTPHPEPSPGDRSVTILTSPYISREVEDLLSTFSTQHLSYTTSARSYISGEQLVSLVIEHWQDLDVLSMIIGAIALRGIRADIEIFGISISVQTPSDAHIAVKEVKRLVQEASEDDDN